MPPLKEKDDATKRSHEQADRSDAKWSRRFFGLSPAKSRDQADAEGDQRREGMAAAGAGLELAVGIGLFGGLGYLGDRAWGTLPWLTVIGALLGMAAGMYQLIKTVGRK